MNVLASRQHTWVSDGVTPWTRLYIPSFQRLEHITAQHEGFQFEGLKPATHTGLQQTHTAV